MTRQDPYESVEITASTLEQAIEDGLKQLGLTRDDVIIEIVEEGSRGVLGMGARSAVVRLTPLRAPSPPAPAPAPKPAPPAPRAEQARPEPSRVEAPTPAASPAPAEPERVDVITSPDDEHEAQIATEALRDLLTHMGIEAEINTYRAEPAPGEEAPWVLDIRGQDLGILIGRRGETLKALQYITRLIVSREIQRRANIVVDVEGYKNRRETALRKLAVRMAQQAKEVGRTMTLEPMPPNERRIIHIALRDDDSVRTESVGTGDQRKVTIIPTQAHT